MKRLAITATLLASSVLTAQTPSAVSSDPEPDAKHPARLVEIAVPSHGEQLLGALYLAAGVTPHPTVILNHGFPGFEQNLDLAQALRREGYNVLAVHYRGSWGVKGAFSYTHALEDADAEVAWITSPENATKYNVDSHRIVLIGHSLGGFIAASATAHNPGVAAAVLISSASIGHRFADAEPADREKAIASYVDKANPVEFLALAGTSPASLGEESFDHRRDWELYNFAPAIGKRPVLLITANDGTGPNSEALKQALQRKGNSQVQHVEIATDHSFSDHRIALEAAILSWLEKQAVLRASSLKDTSSIRIIDDPICESGSFHCAS
ncbi:MAG: alpha/beta fold hydrolase [Acidobacteriaceae bacterium]|nr:alpha/beta fold hydrolase [Acidobacteriaceae bacterium]